MRCLSTCAPRNGMCCKSHGSCSFLELLPRCGSLNKVAFLSREQGPKQKVTSEIQHTPTHNAISSQLQVTYYTNRPLSLSL
eukprot:c14816_g1_i1 orf=1-240(-)